MRHIIMSGLPKIWETIRYSYWAIPSAMALGALGLAFGLLEFDRVEAEGLLSELGWLYTGGSDGAREVVSVIAGSMITVAGVVFSITMVALTLASSQFGPRVLRNFMQDRGNQFVLGTFIATLVFSLMVLRTIEGGDEGFVPQLSVTTSVVMALGSLGVLIYFIHHVALSIQASKVVATIGKELFSSIDRTFPEMEDDSDPANEPALPERFEEDVHVVSARGTGYLQAIDLSGLVEHARKADVVLKLVCRPGDFISPYKPLLLCRPASRCHDSLSDHLHSAFTTGQERSHTQDVLFAVDQLVEVSVRALSPGINDPFTAIRCLDWLGAALSRCLTRGQAPSVRKDEDGNIRVVLDPVTFDDMTDSALQQIQEYGGRSATVTLHVLEIIGDAARHTRMEAERAVLRRHANQVIENSRSELPQNQDRERVEVLYEKVLSAIAGHDGSAEGRRQAGEGGR